MFQYAAGRAISIARQDELLLDISGFANYGLHQGFELQRIFSCPVTIASETDLKNSLGWQSHRLIRRLLRHPAFSKLRLNNFIVEPHFQYWQGIQKLPKNAYLTGYWQSEKYFSHMAATIRSDFNFILPLSEKNAQLAEQISQVNAVSLHVRRGDYVQNPTTLATHGIATLDYYQAAIKTLADSITEPYFFIFSDDIAWAQANLKIAFPCRYINHNQGLESYNDMRLMSLCRHHIIANSSFSWWGAWLNPSADKVVIAPKQWFANQTNTHDLLPQNWIRL